ncbi:MAG: ANTAR domain-containing protein [Rhodobacter sp.]|jgi:response regulator NasT|nr:ANTAR domain-containing protein [Rhodobacter sp.]
MSASMKIAVVEPDRDRAIQIIDALRDDGWTDVTVFAETTSLARRLAELEPDLVLIDLTNPSRDSLEQVSAASDAKGRPVAMFVDTSDEEMTTAAMAAGLSAYVVGSPTPDRIKPVLRTAIARFKLMRQMRNELDAAKQALAERKTIDRAKGMLMRARNVTEEEAYGLLRRTAMDQNRKVIDVAQALLTAAALLK